MSGPEALRRLLAEEFALVLLDVQMPGMDGFETATLMKRHPRTAHVPIIFVTAIHREAAHLFPGYERGAVDYLTKPFDPNILRSKVRVFVDLFVKERQLREQSALMHERESRDREHRTEERFRALLDSMPLCVWALGADGTPVYAQPILAGVRGRRRGRAGTDGGAAPGGRAGRAHRRADGARSAASRSSSSTGCAAPATAATAGTRSASCPSAIRKAS